MRYRTLGPSGLLVSELCLGTMTFGGSDGIWGQIGQLGQDEADQLLRTALDAGINFVDTANVYAGGESERILGQSIRNLGVNRDDVVIATKVLGPMGEGPNARGASRAHILAQAKASLQRLQMDHVDLYQIDHEVLHAAVRGVFGEVRRHVGSLPDGTMGKTGRRVLPAAPTRSLVRSRVFPGTSRCRPAAPWPSPQPPS